MDDGRQGARQADRRNRPLNCVASRYRSINKRRWPARYEFYLDVTLDERWSRWFEGVEIDGSESGTIIRGVLADEAALHGVLAKIRDLRLPLISVRRLDSEEP